MITGIHKNSVFLCLLSLLLASCTAMEHMSIDYLEPAEFSFAKNIRKVGIVSNLAKADAYAWKDTASEEDECYTAKACFKADPVMAADTLAQAVADNGYFEEVMVGDFDFLPRDTSDVPVRMTKEKIAELAKEMDVDFIIALERLDMELEKKISFLSDYMVYYGVTSSDISATISFYQPLSDRPFYTTSTRDTLYWEGYGVNESAVDANFSDESMVHESATYVSEQLARKFLPHWATTNRIYFESGNLTMRNAGVFVREHNWSEARKLWSADFEVSKRNSKKMLLAYNIAMSYEMEDDLDKALQWAQKAEQYASQQKEQDIKKGRLQAGETSDVFLQIEGYLATLEKRIADLAKLNLQMKCFEGNF